VVKASTSSGVLTATPDLLRPGKLPKARRQQLLINLLTCGDRVMVAVVALAVWDWEQGSFYG